MSAHVLLNLLNELGKRDKKRGLPSILSLFCNAFNKFNNTRARMLDSIYHMTNTLKSHFWRQNVIILSLCAQRCYGRHNVSRKSNVNTLKTLVDRYSCINLMQFFFYRGILTFKMQEKCDTNLRHSVSLRSTDNF